MNKKNGFLFKSRDNSHFLIRALFVTLLIIVVYRNDLIILVNEALLSESLSHILLIPFLVGVLIYIKRDLVKGSLIIERIFDKGDTGYIDEAIGTSLCLIALLMYWYGSHTFHPLEFHLLSFPIFLMGVILVLFNSKSLIAFLGPLIFLFFLVPPPLDLVYKVGGIMANLNTNMSYLILKMGGLPVSISYSFGPPSLILASSIGDLTSFTIDVPCSGIYSLMGFLIFAAFLVLMSSAPKISKIGIILIGFLVFTFLNIARLVIIVSVAHFFSNELAMNLFHLLAGITLIFGGMFLTLLIAERILKIEILPRQDELPGCLECERYWERSYDFCMNCGAFLDIASTKITKAFFVKAILLVFGCSIAVLSINAPTFTIASGPVDVTSNISWTNATNVFPQIPGYQLQYLYRDRVYEERAGQDASLMYEYLPITGETSTSDVFVAVGVADSISKLHSWEVCLISMPMARGQNPSVSVLDQRDVTLLPEVPLIARYLVFKNQYNFTQTILYWYEKATFKAGITLSPKYVRINLIIVSDDPVSHTRFEDELLHIGREIAYYWEPIQTRSLLSLGVPAQQLLLISSIAFIAFTKIAQHIKDDLRRTNNQRIFSNLASENEKMILQSIRELTLDNEYVDTREIRSAIERTTGEKINLEALIEILNRLEKYAFVKRDIAFYKNRPKLVWRIY